MTGVHSSLRPYSIVDVTIEQHYTIAMSHMLFTQTEKHNAAFVV